MLVAIACVEAWPRPPHSELFMIVNMIGSWYLKSTPVWNVLDPLYLISANAKIWYSADTTNLFFLFVLFFCSHYKPDCIQSRFWRIPSLTRMERPYKRFLKRAQSIYRPWHFLVTYYLPGTFLFKVSHTASQVHEQSH